MRQLLAKVHMRFHPVAEDRHYRIGPAGLRSAIATLSGNSCWAEDGAISNQLLRHHLRHQKTCRHMRLLRRLFRETGGAIARNCQLVQFVDSFAIREGERSVLVGYASRCSIKKHQTLFQVVRQIAPRLVDFLVCLRPRGLSEEAQHHQCDSGRFCFHVRCSSRICRDYTGKRCRQENHGLHISAVAIPEKESSWEAIQIDVALALWTRKRGQACSIKGG
jgi:hypothetical protein